jgi:hypothetical protein
VKAHEANASRWRGGPNHYEAWHVSVVDPASAAAAWIRYSLHVPDGQSADGRVAELWLAGQTPAGERFARRQTYAVDELHTGAAGFPVLLAGSGLESGRAYGEMADAAWDLRWTPEAGSVRSPLAERRARAHLVTPQPAIRATGSVTVDGATMWAEGWPGYQSHAWGARHADAWAHAHCAAFAAAGDNVDVLTRRASGMPGSVTTALLLADGQGHRAGGPALGLVAEVEQTPERYVFSVRGPRTRIEGEVHAHLDGLVGVCYRDPDGDRVYCYRTDRADMRVRLLRRSRRRWLEALELTAGGCCAYEFARRTPVPGIEVVL